VASYGTHSLMCTRQAVRAKLIEFTPIIGVLSVRPSVKSVKWCVSTVLMVCAFVGIGMCNVAQVCHVTLSPW